MILRGVELENWACIGKLSLSDLPTGVVVLHGPNRTGKSSLLRALRAGLYDFDHDTGHRDLKRNQSWYAESPPRVVVDFEIGGSVYRMSKVFSRRADGNARLEKKIDGSWKVVEDSPREAS